MKYLIAFTCILFALPASADRFYEIRQQWNTCAACHGARGEGSIGPSLYDKSADEIITKLTLYKNGEIVGPQSQMMWPQAMQLTDGQIGTIGVFVQEGFPKE